MQDAIDARIQEIFDMDQASAEPMWADLGAAESSLLVEFNQALASNDPPTPVSSGEQDSIIPDVFRQELEAAADEVNQEIDALDLLLTRRDWLLAYELPTES